MLRSILTERCPNCRKGKLYITQNPFLLRKALKMHPNCSNCGQDFRIEPGFYFGATYVSYGLNILLLALLFAILSAIGKMSIELYLIIWGILAVVLIPVFARMGRTIWIHFFVKRSQN